MGRRVWFAVTVVVALGCLSLSAWQLSRLSARRAENRVAIAGRAQPILDLVNSTDTSSRVQRRVVGRGVFDPGQQIILRGHLLTGAPGVQVITPLRLAGSDSAVLVNRGFVPAADGATPDVAVPDEIGNVEIRGIALAVPRTEDGGSPVTGTRGTSWRRMDLEVLRQRVPYPLMDIYILAEPDTARRGWPRRVEPPALGEGPHLSYAIQWLGIATAVLGFGLFFVLGIGRRESAPDLAVPPPPDRP